MIKSGLVKKDEYLKLKSCLAEILELGFPMMEDNHRFFRKFIIDHPIFKDIHHILSDRVSALMDKQIFPSYNFLSVYNPGKGRCREHLDKSDCRYTVGLCLSQKGDWEFKIADQVFILDEGDSVFYSGTQHKHSRPDMVDGQECIMLLFHFVDKESKVLNNNIIFQNIKDNYNPFVVFKGFLSKEDCESLIQLGEREGFNDSVLNDNEVYSKYRKAKTAWLGNSVETSDIIRTITAAFTDINKQFYGFDLKTACLDFQIVKYEEGDFYTWHKDMGRGQNSLRKLGMVVLLNNADDFKGGKLEFLGLPDNFQPQLFQGSVISFPAYEAHRVTEITNGTRYILSTWAVGEPFK